MQLIILVSHPSACEGPSRILQGGVGIRMLDQRSVGRSSCQA